MLDKKTIKQTAAVVAGVTITAATAYCAGSAFIFASVFKRKKEPLYLSFSNALPNKLDNDYWFENVEKSKQWILGEDDILLNATSIKNENSSNRWVLCAHGYGMSGTQILDVARQFYKKGYNCLLPDFSAHGESEGNYTTLGWKEKEEIKSWIRWILKENSTAEIVLHGVSIGANAILNAAGDGLPENVRCIISDSAYSTMTDLLKYQINQYLKLPLNVLLPGIQFLNKIKSEFSITDADTVKQVKKSEIPTLFIHGEEDSFAPYEMVFDLFYECSAPKDLISFEQSRHADAFLQATYFEKIFDFISRI